MTTLKKFKQITVMLLFALILAVIPFHLLSQDEEREMLPLPCHDGTSALYNYFKEYMQAELPKKRDGDIIGGSQGLTKIAEDAFQAIGQVIIDKATTTAFNLLKKRIQEFLKCQNNCLSENNRWCFPCTCQVIDNIRFEEIMTSRNVLYKALIQDALFNINNKMKILEDTLPGNKQAIVKLLREIIMEIILEKLTNLNKPLDTTCINLISGRITDFFMKQLEHPETMDKHSLQAAVAVLTVWQARKHLVMRDFNSAPIKQFLDNIISCFKDYDKRLLFGNPGIEWSDIKGSDTYNRILKMATLFHGAIISTENSLIKKESFTKAYTDLIEILFETAYYVVNKDNKAVMDYEEAKYQAGSGNIDLNNDSHILFFIKDVVDGGINRDINSIIYTVNRFLKSVEVTLSSDETKKVARSREAIRLIGAVLLYAQTYADTAMTDKTAQEKRTAIIKSLVMDRTQRDRGVVFSFGGSVRGIFQLNKWKKGTAEIADTGTYEKKSVYGPFSVPIGFGADWFAFKKAGGIHFEFSIVDVGQFTSFDTGSGVVEKPQLADIFSPSAAVGLFTALEGYPLYIGVTYGYSPKYYFSKPGEVKKGSLNWGIVIGIYVPLIDFN